MSAAVHAVVKEGMSIRRASITYNVPKRTLSERLGDKRPSLPPLKGSDARYLATRHAWSKLDMEKALAAIQ
jgi:transposase